MLEAPSVHVGRADHPPLTAVESHLDDYVSVDEAVLRPNDERRVYHFSDYHADPRSGEYTSRRRARAQAEQVKAIKGLARHAGVTDYVIEGLGAYEPVGNAMHTEGKPPIVDDGVREASVDRLTDYVLETNASSSELLHFNDASILLHGGDEPSLHAFNVSIVDKYEELKASPSVLGVDQVKRLFGCQTEKDKLVSAFNYSLDVRSATLLQRASRVASKKGSAASSMGAKHTDGIKRYAKDGEATINAVSETRYYERLSAKHFDIPVENTSFIFFTPNSFA